MQAASITLEEQPKQIKYIEEQDNIDNLDTPGPSSIQSSIRTRRTAAISILSKKEAKPVSSAVVLSEKIYIAFKLLADIKIEPERILS